MASPNPDQGGTSPDREAVLQARIAQLEARVLSQAAEIEATYAILGRERADRLRSEAALRQEQRIYQALFKHSPIGIQIFDRQGFSLRLNEAQRELLGLPDLEYGIGHFNALTDPLQIVSGVAETFRRAYAGEHVHLLEQMVDLALSANTWQTAREIVHYNQHLFPVYDEEGNVEAVITFNEDVTEAYTTRQALSTANQLIEGLFEHAPLALQIFDRKGFSFRMNETNRRLLGVPSRDYGIGEFNALTDPFMIAQGHAALYAKAYAGEVVRMPILIVDFDDPTNTWGTGRRRARIEQILFPILDEDENVTAVVSCTLEAIAGQEGRS
jgi:PAS domain-containing protein